MRLARREGSQGQHESMLLSRQPRGCKASLLCKSLWMIYPNTLVSPCAVVDEQGCGKVDNRRKRQLFPSRGPSAFHIRSELSTVQPVAVIGLTFNAASLLSLIRLYLVRLAHCVTLRS